MNLIVTHLSDELNFYTSKCEFIIHLAGVNRLIDKGELKS